MDQQQLRIGSYNLFEGAQTTYNRLVEFARGAELDVLCLQEVNGWQNDDMQRCKDFSDKILFLDYAFANSNTEYKLATFTRHPATGKDAIVESFWHGVCITRLMVAGQEVTIANLHLDPWKEESRVREIDRLLSLLDLSKPIIITGDFNSLSRADNYPAQLLEDLRAHGISKFGTQELAYDVTDRLQQAGFIDIAAQLHTYENTVPSKFNTDKDHELPARLDYVFASPSLAACATKIEVVKTELTDAISDHYPVIVTFQFGAASSPAAPADQETGVSDPPDRTPHQDDAQPSPAQNPDGIEREPDGSVVLPLHLHDDR